MGVIIDTEIAEGDMGTDMELAQAKMPYLNWMYPVDDPILDDYIDTINLYGTNKHTRCALGYATTTPAIYVGYIDGNKVCSSYSQAYVIGKCSDVIRCQEWYCSKVENALNYAETRHEIEEERFVRDTDKGVEVAGYVIAVIDSDQVKLLGSGDELVYYEYDFLIASLNALPERVGKYDTYERAHYEAVKFTERTTLCAYPLPYMK